MRRWLTHESLNWTTIDMKSSKVHIIREWLQLKEVRWDNTLQWLSNTVQGLSKVSPQTGAETEVLYDATHLLTMSLQTHSRYDTMPGSANTVNTNSHPAYLHCHTSRKSLFYRYNRINYYLKTPTTDRIDNIGFIVEFSLKQPVISPCIVNRLNFKVNTEPWWASFLSI